MTNIEDHGQKPPFRVVTHKNWLADQFRPQGAVQDHGFDIDPSTAMETIWWAPGAWVASAYKAGITLPLTSCGPYWLDYLDPKYSGRIVKTTRVPEVGKWPHDKRVFMKLPEAKLDSFEAQSFPTPYHRESLKQFHLPDDALVTCQEIVNFIIEARFWVAHRTITASSLYRWGDLIWGSEGFDVEASTPQGKGVIRRMYETLMDMIVDGQVSLPPGCVIDMGLTTDDRCLVVEANAAWSSGPYNGSPAGVYTAIKAAHDFEGEHSKWAWKPNPVFDKVQPLKVVSR